MNRLDADRSVAIGDMPIIVDMPSCQPEYSSVSLIIDLHDGSQTTTTELISVFVVYSKSLLRMETVSFP